PGNLDPSPAKLQSLRESLRGEIESTTDPHVKRVLSNVVDQMTTELQAKVPGIAVIDSKYAELGSQKRALDPSSSGSRAFVPDRASVQRPEELANTLTAAGQPKGSAVAPSGEALRLTQAARAELDRIVGTNRNDIAALDRIIGQPEDWNAKKLA